MSLAPLAFQTTSEPARSGWPLALRAWIPVFLFICLLAVESTATFGSDRTSRPLHDALHSVVGSAVDPNWELAHHLIRKTGHFFGYGFFSVLLFRAFRRPTGYRTAQLSTRIRAHALAVAGVFLTGSLDEFHQSFLPNRTSSFNDVLLDTAGALMAQIALMAFVHLLRDYLPSWHFVPVEPSAESAIESAAEPAAA